MIKTNLMKVINKVFFAVLILLTFSCNTSKNQEIFLPILGERDVEYSMKNGKEVADTIYHVVPDFEYRSQDSALVNSKDIKHKVWIADFFFTSCPTICPPMTSNMQALSENVIDLKEYIQFLSFSIDPKRDTPQKLRGYIESRDINDDYWYFLIGDEDATHLLAKSFFNGAERNSEVEGGFGHTDYFALVDTKGHVRGIYRGTDFEQMALLEKNLRQLLKQEYGIVGPH